MCCWNGLSAEQQHRLLTWGNLPIDWPAAATGSCPNPAEVEVTTMWDVAPGPRFYCASCALKYMRQVFDQRRLICQDDTR
jgi:hypothetical protein